LNSARPTLVSVASEILTMYRTLGGKKAVSDAIKRQNLVGRRLLFLEEAAAGRMTLDGMTQQQAILLQETLLDATALRTATGGRATVFDSLKMQHPVLLGGSRYRRAKLRETDDALLDCTFKFYYRLGVRALI
jgi:hypothetical protein